MEILRGRPTAHQVYRGRGRRESPGPIGAPPIPLEREDPARARAAPRSPLAPVSVEQIPQAAEDRPLLPPPAAGLRGRGVDAAREPAERQRLEPHGPGA